MKLLTFFVLAFVSVASVFDTYAATPTIAGGDGCWALKSDGSLWVWGYNGSGEFGNGTYATSINGQYVNNTYTPVHITATGNVAKVSGGPIVIDQVGNVWSWGSNYNGEVGLGDVSLNYPWAVLTPQRLGGIPANSVSNVSRDSGYSFAVKTDGSVLYWGFNHLVPSNFPGLSNITKVVGDLALKSDGTVWGWGNNEFGQLGNTNLTYQASPGMIAGLSQVIAIDTQGISSLALKSDGTVWEWGVRTPTGGIINIGGSLQPNPYITQVANLSGVIAIAAGATHSLALKSDGTVWAWGYNGVGEIGDGTRVDRASPTQVSGLSGVIGIAAGTQYSLALKNDGSVLAWGSNYFGSLGLPSTVPDAILPQYVAISLSSPSKPANDDFVNATLINGASGAINGAIAGATRELNEPSHGGSNQSVSVWSRWVAPASGQVTLSTSGSNSPTPLGVAVYTGTAINALTSVGGSVFQAQAGKEYKIATYNASGVAYGTAALSWTLNTAAQADLSITSTRSPNPAYSNDAINYSITITNNGPQVATNVRVTDILPPNTTGGGSTGCSLAAGVLTCSLNNLSPGASTSLTIVLTSTVAPQTINNVISVASEVPDSNSANNTSPTSVNVLAGVNTSAQDADVPTLPQWGAIIFAILLMSVSISAQRRARS